MSKIKFTYLDKVIHEMNGQIHNILSLSDIMLFEKVKFSDTENKENLMYINNAATKLSRITKSLSSITNNKINKIIVRLKKVDLVKLVKLEIKNHQVCNSLNHDLKIILQNKIPSCIAKVDSFWFNQMLANLIVNAVNHCHKGSIEVITDVIVKENINYFSIIVNDEGYGIPESELETIFEPLERGSRSLERNIPGSGIGLAIVKEIIEAHGGSILARNRPKIGAAFEIIIPICK